ncbi:MAG: hypothetical protein QY325_07995 [Flavobacteriales bacterium]|jgi:methylmalonyl-CoA mutase|nr:MAG: hypothetical protein QY325_07995 [Flavobacteriales bacterium]
MSTFVQAPPYVPKHKIRVVTAASLFDGHDAAINIMRRIIQSTGAEVIHPGSRPGQALGHDRGVEDVVNIAL